MGCASSKAPLQEVGLSGDPSRHAGEGRMVGAGGGTQAAAAVPAASRALGPSRPPSGEHASSMVAPPAAGHAAAERDGGAGGSPVVRSDAAPGAAAGLDKPGPLLVGASPDPRFQATLSLLRSLFQVQLALVSLAEGSGLDAGVPAGPEAGTGPGGSASAGSGGPSLACWVRWVMALEPGVVVWEDMREDSRLQGSAFVQEPTSLRFFAAAPVVGAGGRTLGALCVLDTRRRRFEAQQYCALEHCAQLVARELGEGSRAQQAQHAKHEPASCYGIHPPLAGAGHSGGPGPPAHPAAEVAGALSGRLAQQEQEQEEHQEQAGVDEAEAQQQREQLLRLLQHPLLRASAQQQQEQRQAGAADPGSPPPAPAPPAPAGQAQAVLLSGSSSSRGGGGGSGAAAVFRSSLSSEPEGPSLEGSSLSSAVLTPITAVRAVTPSSGESRAAQLLAFAHMRPKVFEEVTLGSLVGQGSNGRVYRGLWQGGHVVVKIIDCLVDPAHLLQGPSCCAALGDPHSKGAVVEAVLGRSLAHPHIVPTYDYAVSTPEELPDGQGGARVRQQVWVIMGYCNRGTLLDAIQRGDLRDASGAPSLLTILRTAQEIAGALVCLHSHGVLHGDLTSSNVMLSSSSKDSRRWIAQVADFGLSRVIQSNAISTQSLGTVTAMPPELLSTGLLTPQTDAYSFGVLLWEMWAGHRAWKGMNATQVMTAVALGGAQLEAPADAPPAFQELIRQCLQRDYTQRPSFESLLSSVQDQLQELRAAAASVTTPDSSIILPLLTAGRAGRGRGPGGSSSAGALAAAGLDWLEGGLGV